MTQCIFKFSVSLLFANDTLFDDVSNYAAWCLADQLLPVIVAQRKGSKTWDDSQESCPPLYLYIILYIRRFRY